ncbi:MAG: hypothetical protein RMK49_01320 [Abditibacteriales bacterium]|nr:hypothetical protein [Abditibacteriales bacterium]
MDGSLKITRQGERREAIPDSGDGGSGVDGFAPLALTPCGGARQRHVGNELLL